MNLNSSLSSEIFTTSWFYEKRESISFSAALAIFLALAVMWLMPKSYKEPAIAATEMMALLENMPTPQIEKPIEKKIQDKKVENKVEKVQTNVTEKVAEAPVVNDPFAEKASPSPAKQTKSDNQVASTPPPPSTVMQQAASLAARYESILRAYLEKIKRYPSSREARLARPEGIVRVWLELSRTGELIAVGILESSGFNLLDSETIKTIKSGTFPAFPDGAFIGETTHKFIANLNYTISSN